MKVWKYLGVVVVAPLLLFIGAAAAQAVPGSKGDPAVSTENLVHVELTGYLREGRFRDPDTSKPIPYLYLELKEPIGKYVNNLKPSNDGYRNVELVGGSSRIIHRLEDLVDKKITVQGELPFLFDANAPRIVLPLVMLMDTSNPQLFR